MNIDYDYVISNLEKTVLLVILKLLKELQYNEGYKCLFPKWIEDIEKEMNYIIKGRFLHKQVDITADEEAKYGEISRIIRYDKYIRDVLYKYLSALEEQWRAIAFDSFDYEYDKTQVIKKRN